MAHPGHPKESCGIGEAFKQEDVGQSTIGLKPTLGSQKTRKKPNLRGGVCCSRMVIVGGLTQKK